jgi:hypothetical protein
MDILNFIFNGRGRIYTGSIYYLLPFTFIKLEVEVERIKCTLKNWNGFIPPDLIGTAGPKIYNKRRGIIGLKDFYVNRLYKNDLHRTYFKRTSPKNSILPRIW